MANFDQINDTTPVLTFDHPSLPIVSAMRTAIAGSAVSASYPTAWLDAATKNDLVYACRVNSIAVAGL
jgi:hypothetical protein